MGVCYLEFSMAFDFVKHKLVPSKMQVFGVNDRLYEWIKDSLRNSAFYFQVGKENSCAL